MLSSCIAFFYTRIFVFLTTAFLSVIRSPMVCANLHPHPEDLNIVDACTVASIRVSCKPFLFNFSSQQKIEFRDAHNLNNILKALSVAPHQPGKLHAGEASTLFYVNRSTKPFDIYCLDLTKSTRIKVIHTQHSTIDGVCFVQNGDKQLLVVTDRSMGVFAYNTETDELEWNVVGKPSRMYKRIDASGVATDGRGHLYVGDYLNGNWCIQMFSASDGQHLRYLSMEVLGHVGRLDWCEQTSSLMVASLLKEKWHFSVIHIKY